MICKDFEVKDLEVCEPGELVRFGADNGSYLAMAVRRGEDFRMTVLVLHSTDQDTPTGTIERFGMDMKCVSYGTGWVLELQSDPDTWPGNADGMNTPGEIRCFPNSVGMIVQGLDQRSRGLLGLLNLTEFRAVGQDRFQGARVRRWRIWARDEDRGRIGASCLTQFPTPEH